MEMSVAKALLDLKRTDTKIARSCSNAKFVGIKVGGCLQGDITAEKPLSDLNKIKDLIAYRKKLKAAISQSNATTKVNLPLVGEITVAGAIEYKKFISYELELANMLMRQYHSSKAKESDLLLKNEQAVERLVTSALGSDVKKNGDEYNAIATPYFERHNPLVFDPLNASVLAEKMLSDIEEFENNVDFILNESNALTKIVV